MRTRSYKKRLLVGALLGVAVFFAILSAYGRTRTDTAPESSIESPKASLTVSVEPVLANPMPSTVAATGTVEPWQEAVIGAETSNLRLTEVLVAEGDRVTKGDVLARLDNALLSAQLAEQKAAIEQARATLESAEAASGRAQKLLTSKAISAETAEERATAVKTATAQVAQAQAAFTRIEAELERTEVRAPFDGVISTKPAVAGSVVQAGTELARIIRDGKLEVALQVAEKDLRSIEPGQTATITDASGATTSGSVSSVAQKVDATTRLGTVRISLGAESPLKPGMFARVSIETGVSRTLSVADSALVWRDGKPSVFVVGADSKVSAREVETGTHGNGRVAITSGLQEGENVVVAGAGFLTNGSLVRVAANDFADANTSSETIR